MEILIPIFIMLFLAAGWLNAAMDADMYKDYARTSIEISMRHALRELASNKEACALIAKELEIEADGGDSPGDFVSYVLDKFAYTDGEPLPIGKKQLNRIYQEDQTHEQ